ncbi:MAG TPA: hypothetical protein VFQ79_01970 [Bryobacteraceae bacterium]|nr:hypothetical protein [Bryobacteraceae bacterium]
MRYAALLLCLALPVLSAQDTVRVGYTAIQPVEANFNGRIEKFDIDNPIRLIGSSRGVYLDGYGVVLTAEVDLLPSASLTPFRPRYTDPQKEQLRVRKLERVDRLRDVMRDMLVDTAAALDTVPLDQQIVVAVTIFYWEWERRQGLPSQILMQAPRRTLVEYKAGGIARPALDAALKVREY